MQSIVKSKKRFNSVTSLQMSLYQSVLQIILLLHREKGVSMAKSVQNMCHIVTTAITWTWLYELMKLDGRFLKFTELRLIRKLYFPIAFSQIFGLKIFKYNKGNAHIEDITPSWSNIIICSMKPCGHYVWIIGLRNSYH